MQSRLLKLLVILCCLSLINLPVSAQTGRVVRLSSPDTSQFPIIQVYLDVHDSSGSFVHNLLAEQVSMIESGKNIPVNEIEEIRPGVQFVVAINPGVTFPIRNAQGISRYDLIKEALQKWATSRLGSNTDDWSLLVGQEAGISHTSEPAEFIDGLEAADGNQKEAQASIDVLASAVKLASDPVSRPGMGKAILFITSPIEGDYEQAIKDISDLAKSQEISISIWLVASRGAVMNQSTELLLSLALNNGGQVFTFSGDESIPNLDGFLDDLRSLYRLTYSSQSGLDSNQKFWVEVKFDDEVVQSNQLSFQVDLLPPLPAFIAPPISIERSIVIQAEDSSDSKTPAEQESPDILLPTEIELQVIFDFPDGLKRELVRSALLVDGTVIAENLAPPFDQFKWDLQNFLSDTTAQIQVECTDSLGLSGRSVAYPVKISVIRPERDPMYLLRKRLWTVVALFFLLAAGLSLWALILGGKLRPFTQMSANQQLRGKRSTNQLSAPEKISPGPINWQVQAQPLPSPSQSAPNQYLERIDSQSKSQNGSAFPLIQQTILVGSDSLQSNIVLVEADIDPVHARFEMKENGECWIFDNGAIGGTWVNYTLISENGTKLSSGDLIHFGRTGFVFKTKENSAAPKPGILVESSQKSNIRPDAAANIEKGNPE